MHAPAQPPFVRRGRLFTALTGFSLLVGAVPSRAVDATLDLRGNRQNARTETRTFESYWRRELVTARQSFRFTPTLAFEAQTSAIRETAGTDATGTSLESQTRSYQPEGTLSYRSRTLQGGLRSAWFERRNEGDTALPPETHRLQLGAWLEARLTPSTRISGNLTGTRTEDELTDGPNREQRDRTGFARAEQALGRTWRFEYGLSGTSTDLTADDSHRTFFMHDLELRGSPRLSDRLRAHIRARTLFFRQKHGIGVTANGGVLGSPLSGGVALDDTPGALDPLEADPVPVPALYDRDRSTATSINLGDSAPAVREFGGDYRNILFDLGDTATFTSAFLYADRRLLNPELYQWRVFVTDDPDGRLWEELGSDRVTVQYTELGGLLQGWAVTFAGGVSGRFFKMVDVKLGPAIPDLFVTELEVFVRRATGKTEETENSRDHRLETSFSYDVTQALRLGYESRVRLRRFDEDPADVGRGIDDVSHGLRSSWSSGSYIFGGRLDVREITGSARSNTDVRSYQLSATRRQPERVYGTLSWNRTDDRSGGRNQTTDTFSLIANWRAFPGLRFGQRLSHGRRRDQILEERALSYVVSHRIEAAPVRSLTLQFDRSDRWSDRVIGSGFQRFSETLLELIWSPVPLITAYSDLRYQERDRSEWTSRQTLTWSPFPDASLRPTFTADSFYDSRFDSWEPGVRAAASWRLRTGLLVEGSVGIRRFELEGERTTPVDLEIHVAWSP